METMSDDGWVTHHKLQELRDENVRLKEQLKAAQQEAEEYEERLLECRAIPSPYYDMHVLDEDGTDELRDSVRGREVLGLLREKVGIWEVTSAGSPWLFYDMHGQDNQKAHNKCASLGAGFEIYGTAGEMWCWDGVEELHL